MVSVNKLTKKQHSVNKLDIKITPAIFKTIVLLAISVFKMFLKYLSTTKDKIQQLSFRVYTN